VAFRWRIRHKLLLGLGLVGGIIALLLAGALYGLWSYRATMKSIVSKLAEQREAEEFKARVTELSSLKDCQGEQKVPNPVAALQNRIKRAGDALDEYESRLQDTLNHGRDPDQGVVELELVQSLRSNLARLQNASEQLMEGQEFGTQGSSSILDATSIQEPVNELTRDSGKLVFAILGDVEHRTHDPKGPTRHTLWLVFSTSIFGIILLASLLRMFYGWVFYPIRDLEQSAGRLAQGDFEHRIEVRSGDEMEDLAAAFNNMTDRLRLIYRDLARQVNERSRQLVRSERLASVGFLAAGVAHEINNPLASIAFCSEALEKRLISLLDRETANGRTGESEFRKQESGVRSQPSAGTSLIPDPCLLTPQCSEEWHKDREIVARYLKMIQEEAFRCKAITQRLLEFSRGGERRREPTDLAELAQSVLDMVQHLQNCKGKHIVFEPAGRIIAWVNAQEIKSVVLNLVVNALDSMDDGGTLTLTLRQRDTMAEMVFADTGCGMTTETLENIFEPFFTRSRTGKGTGLGLSISHRVISQHGGEIDAVSPGLNQGSTFTVRLPLQPAEPVKEDALAHAAA
jgi:signal transduction histidine kinase